MDYQQFYAGASFDAYECLGAHLTGGGAAFQTFAPAAAGVSVIGDFNGWQETPMERVYDGNFWACRVENAVPGMRYKYRIYQRDGSFLDRADPYGFSAELRPDTASVLFDGGRYTFHDQAWLDRRNTAMNRPLNIYEVHAGSWRKPSAAPDSWYSYEELAERLIPYLTEQAYDYVELMPLCEYPSDESWGYQITGFFAPTARYGTPDGLKYFIDQCHQRGIGVLLDFVSVHFAVNDFALWNYDGTAIYEYPHRDVGYSQWGSCNFMHARGEVRSFLQSAACYWLKEFHFDGLRLDAVSNLIYWQGDPARGECQPGLRFLRGLNAGLRSRLPDVLLIAEDSTAYPGVTSPVEEGGLGFDYKWDLGWMNDTLAYFRLPPSQRPGQSHLLTFSMDYFYNERYLLPLSHDEVVHGKGTIVNKMYGNRAARLAQARALYLYQFTHPGAKLNFMGNELGQLREWDEKRELDWNLLDRPEHAAFCRYMRALNRLYRRHPALWSGDCERSGFQWLEGCRPDQCLFGFIRSGGGERLLTILNFSDQSREFVLSTQKASRCMLLLSSDWEGEAPNGEPSCEGKELRFVLAPYSAACYAMDPAVSP